MAELNSPTSATIKRLFAVSGNFRAFPKCTNLLVDGKSVTGEVCHIKGARLKGTLFESAQSDTERHSYDNLILLCPIHHKVIDDDDETSTVDRLHRMKNAPEQRAPKLSEDDARRIASVFVDGTVHSENQSGGVTAHAIIGNTLNLHAGGAEPARTLKAIEKLWNITVDLRKQFGDAEFIGAAFAHYPSLSVSV